MVAGSQVVPTPVTERREPPGIVVPIVGGALVVVGVLVAVTRAFGLVYLGLPSHDVIGWVPFDVFPPGQPLFLTAAIAAGAVLFLAGAIILAAWFGYRAGRRRAPSGR